MWRTWRRCFRDTVLVSMGLSWEVHWCADGASADQKRQDIYRWLAAPDPYTNHVTNRKKRQPQTGVWLLRSKQYEHWLQSEKSFLWIYGIRESAIGASSWAFLIEWGSWKRQDSTLVCCWYLRSTSFSLSLRQLYSHRTAHPLLSASTTNCAHILLFWLQWYWQKGYERAHTVSDHTALSTMWYNTTSITRALQQPARRYESYWWGKPPWNASKLDSYLPQRVYCSGCPWRKRGLRGDLAFHPNGSWLEFITPPSLSH